MPALHILLDLTGIVVVLFAALWVAANLFELVERGGRGDGPPPLD